MKKILLAVFLLVVLIGVSYYNANRSNERVKEEYQQGLKKGTQEAAVFQHKSDSLEQTLQRDRTTYADSIKRLASAQTTAVTVADSLTRVVDSQNKQIAALAAKNKKAASKPRLATAPKKSESAGLGIKHAQILEYYRNRLKTLSSDLSDQERLIALNEIREETARKFLITVDDLNRIGMDSQPSH